MSKQNQICPECGGYMVEKSNYPGWLRCSCGYAVKVLKRIIKPIGKKR